MPVPASDAIASDLGHGALGLRDGLRPLSELLAETSGQRHVWVEMRLALLVTGWGLNGGAVYVAGVASASWDGVLRDVVGVKTSTETLARVETLALCTSQQGSYYYSPGSLTAPRWDDGVTLWDGGGLWDQGPELFVHLTNDAVASQTDIVAQFGVFVGTHGVWQPTLGVDKLTDGKLEVWTSSTDLTSWTEAAVGAGGGAVNRDSATVRQGTYSCRIDGSLNAAGGRAISQAGMSGVAGAHYRASGYYRTEASNPAGVTASIRAGISGSYLLVDGVSTTAGTTGLALANTNGDWRRFAFDFRCPADTSALELAALAYNSTGGALSGTVRFDALSVQRIYRFEFAEPLLTLDGVPSLDAGRQDAFYGPVGVSLGRLAIANGGGRFEPLLALFDWTNQEAIVRLGGRFVNGGNEVLFDDCGVHAVGLMSDPAVSDSRVSVQLEDARQRLRPSLSTRYYTEAEFTSLADKDKGRVRPLVFGVVTDIRPARIGLNSSGYGIYEVADVTGSPAGMARWGVFTRFFSHLYTDEAAASKVDSAADFPISYSPSEILGDETTGRFEVLQDVRILRITYENNVVDFDIGGAALKATVTPGIWTLQGWGEQILKPAMNTAAGVSDISVVYSSATYTFTISKAAGTLNLLCSTGANRGNGMWGVLGFSSGSNRTGALSYLADSAVSQGAEQHVIRVDAKGFIDDASGTYTGTASALLEKAPDVALYLLNRHLGVPFASIDSASFVAARAVHTAPLSVYLGALSGGSGGSSVSAFEVLEQIENGAGADISLEGDTWRWRTRDTSTPADVVDLYDYDLLAWEPAGYKAEDYYAVVRVSYGQDPTSGAAIVTQQTRSEVGVRFGRPDQRTFATYLANASDAATRLASLSLEAATKRARYRFLAKGKLLLTPIGGKVRITRAKGLSATGALSSKLVRIIRKSDDIGAWTSDVEAIEVV